tara:strand:- start:479 stop:622 length:144 start_codon:yes stop_codon:yes gene_type:complete
MRSAEEHERQLKVERLLDKYNHIMELIRTLLGVIGVLLQIYIITRLL